MADTYITITNAIIYMDDAVDALQNISNQVAQMSIQVQRQIGSFNTFGLGATQKVAGKPNFTAAIQGYPTTSDGTTEYHRLMTAWNAANSMTARSFRAQHPDAAAGAFQFDFEAFCNSYQFMGQDANGNGTPPLHQGQLEIDGDLTVTYIS